ncbi:hypothetical protein Hypma_014827 [Hypsizygus marmoreus]|uniref:DUF6534 domain-containing protein n=1 Tax=Hypsizygus marmoreus TaxID=39966 RepID=A0A369K7V0_HYPMA|nr:hypothetical protein Hypma_014827 [Hypsizygus marmoreus]
MAFVNSSVVYTPSAEASFDFVLQGGGLLVGTFLAFAVWGASCLQVFLYFIKYDKDSTAIRYFVGILWIFDTINQFFLAKGSWRIFVTLYGSPTAALAAPRPEFMHHGWIAVIVSSAVQLYFIHRIYIFAKTSVYGFFKSLTINSILAAMIILTAWQLVGLILLELHGFQSPTLFTTKQNLVYHLSYRAATAAVDVIIAACMVFLLTRQTPQFRRSRKLIHRLLIISISSGTFTALLVSIILILLAVYPNAFYWCTVEHPLCSVYLSTLLANLNTREYVRGDCEANTSPDIEMSGIAEPSRTTHVLRQLRGLDQVPDRIHIHVERHTEQDSNGKLTSVMPKSELEHACSHDDHVIF